MALQKTNVNYRNQAGEPCIFELIELGKTTVQWINDSGESTDTWTTIYLEKETNPINPETPYATHVQYGDVYIKYNGNYGMDYQEALADYFMRITRGY